MFCHHPLVQDDDDDGGFGGRTMSLFGGKKKDHNDDLPPNWKKAKDKDGTVYYFNSVTGVSTWEKPPQ